jgi:prephenate dehydrogenase/chorismate mutase
MKSSTRSAAEKKKKPSRPTSASSPTSYLSKLERSRKRMSLLTLSILKDVKKRQNLAREIARIKDSQGKLEIENIKVEGELKKTVDRYSEEIKLDSLLASKITDILLESSKIAQRREIYGKKIISFFKMRGIHSMSIVGAGRMGGWFARYFRCLGIQVYLFDKNSDFARKRALELDCSIARDVQSLLQSDLIVVAIPISETMSEIRKLLYGTNEGVQTKGIIEVSSIKGEISSQRIERPRVPIISIHPLFGASAPLFARNMIAVIKPDNARDKSGLRLIKQIFPHYDVLQISAREHDKDMAVLLSLPHLFAIVFADVVSRNGFSKTRSKLVTPSYSAMKEFATRTLSENPDVYFEIQAKNKFARGVIKNLADSLDRISHYLESDDKAKFRELFQKASNKNVI